VISDPGAQVIDGHPVHARRAAVRPDPLVGVFKVRSTAHRFHRVLRQGSFLFPCRGRLLLLGCRRSGSAFPADAVAQHRLGRLVEEVSLGNAALLPLHAHRKVQAAPSWSNSALRPMVRAAMASADFSRLSETVSGPLLPSFCLKASSPPHLAVTQLPSANGSGHPPVVSPKFCKIV
jgi:hypothetical protein